MCGVATNTGGLLQGDRLIGRRETTGAVVAANGGQEVVQCNVKIDFDNSKGEALGIQQD